MGRASRLHPLIGIALGVGLAAKLLVQGLRERWRVPALLLVDGAISTLLFADVVHFRFFGEPLSVAEAIHGWQLGVVITTVFSGIKPADWLLHADVAAGGLAWVCWLRATPDAIVRPATRPVVARLGLGVAAALAVAPLYLVWTDPEEVFFYGTRRREVVAALGVLPYHAYLPRVGVGITREIAVK